jgi:hypothetical protein
VVLKEINLCKLRPTMISSPSMIADQKYHVNTLALGIAFCTSEAQIRSHALHIMSRPIDQAGRLHPTMWAAL